jgi:hypothetical protein
MEQILDVYQRPYNPKNPVICFDETNKQHIQEVVTALPTREGHVRKEDSEYIRGGTSNIFMFFEPLAGKRYVEITDQRTAIDFADAMKLLVDELYPLVPNITVVMDNLNTHTKVSL